MSARHLSSGTVLVDDDLRGQAEGLIAQAHDRRPSALFLSLDDGQQIEVGADLARFFLGILEGMTRGPVSVVTMPDELTTTTAAELLGVSRPTLMKLIAAGGIPASKVGSHTRLATRDVLGFARLRDARRESAFAALRALDDEIGGTPEMDAE